MTTGCTNLPLAAVQVIVSLYQSLVNVSISNSLLTKECASGTGLWNPEKIKIFPRYQVIFGAGIPVGNRKIVQWVH